MNRANGPASPQVTLIAAMDEAGVIGARGGMPWHVPDDLQWFKRHTVDKPILMGRRTHESIGRALPKRRNLVLTRNPGFTAAGCECVASVDAALAAAGDAGQLMVIGGAEVFALTLPLADRLLITRIAGRHDGDTWFPAVDWTHWRLLEQTEVAGDDDVPWHAFMTWHRRPA